MDENAAGRHVRPSTSDYHQRQLQQQPWNLAGTLLVEMYTAEIRGPLTPSLCHFKDHFPNDFQF